MKKRAGCFCAVLAVLACTAATSWGQTATGQITGTVSDASGALVSDAKIKITSTLTGLSLVRRPPMDVARTPFRCCRSAPIW